MIKLVIAGLDPAIHHFRKNICDEDGHPKSGLPDFGHSKVRKSDKSDLRGQARG
jgi:hypothetical protein